MNSAYSTTPLAKKLGLKSGYTMLTHRLPKQYFDLFSDWPEDVTVKTTMDTKEADFIHLFVKTIEELKQIAPTCKQILKKDGLLWISWPKGTSSIYTDLKRDIIRNYLIDLGLVDVKVASIDKDWSGLKFVYRLKDR